MKLSTKSIGSLLIATAAAVKDAGRRTREEHLERILQHHDRKGELRASLLGMSPIEFRSLQKHHRLDEIIRTHGYRNIIEFRQALFGKLRSELQQRGWSRHRIDSFVDHKLAPVA